MFILCSTIRIKYRDLKYHDFDPLMLPPYLAFRKDKDASTKRPQPVFILSIKSSLNDFIPDK
jgi:hypothetical protein